MIIIAESGATKTDWRSVSDGGKVLAHKSAGMNVASSRPEFVLETLKSAIPCLNPHGESVTEVHFYAAGLIPDGNKVPESAANIDAEFRKMFPDAEIEYASDLLDAARAVCGHGPGIAVILGTGSNSCEYDGKRIVRNVRSGGFILGDEGGSASLGKMFVSDFIKGLVPQPLADEFSSKFESDYLTIVRNVYRGEAPARYLGSFSPFILEHYDSEPYVRELVRGNLRSLFDRCLAQYDLSKYEVGFVGGFGYALRDVLAEIAGEYGVRISVIMPSPIDGLLRYHCPDLAPDERAR